MQPDFYHGLLNSPVALEAQQHIAEGDRKERPAFAEQRLPPGESRSAAVSRQPTVDCRRRTVDCGLRTGDCGLRTGDCGLSTVDCRLSTVGRQPTWTPCRVGSVFVAAAG